jgi:hypothetical protein
MDSVNNKLCTYTAQGVLVCDGMVPVPTNNGSWKVRGIDSKGYALTIKEVPPFEESSEIQGHFTTRQNYGLVRNQPVSKDMVLSPVYTRGTMFPKP